jgi:transposase
MNDITNTLYVGIDVSKDSNQVCAVNFTGSKLGGFKSPNNKDGAEIIEQKLLDIVTKTKLINVIIVLEATGIYSIHIATYLSVSEKLTPYNILVYCLNPKSTSNYQRSFTDLDKTDPNDAFMLADFARVGRTNSLTPYKGPQKTALQRLTRHRKHLADLLASEKTRVLNDIFIKFSDFNNSSHDNKVFSNTFGATAQAVILEYKTTDEIINEPIDNLIEFIKDKSRNRVDSKEIALALKKAARASFRLDKTAYDPINLAIASSFNVINCLENEIKEVDKAILKTVKGFNETEYKVLLAIPGIGPVYAGGILAEIGSITQFSSEEALAKYAGVTWRQKQSGNFQAEETYMTKTGNDYLRYYLMEATQMAVIHNPTFNEYFNKKVAEVTTHQYKRALALTCRKFIRLVYGLMSKNQLYTNK